MTALVRPHPPTVAVSGLHRGENPQPGPAVIRALRRARPGLRVIGLSYDTLESGLFSPFDDAPDAVYSMPFPGAGLDSYASRLEEIHRLERLDALIPCLDSELPVLTRLAGRLDELGIRACLPEAAALRARDKERLPDLCRLAGVATPRTIAVSSPAELFAAAAELGYPLFVKGSLHEAIKVTNPVGLEAAFLDLVARWGGPILLQRAVVGEEYDVVGLGDGDGGIVAHCAIRKTLVSRAGKGYAGIVVENEALDALAGNLIGALAWDGPFELELVLPQEPGAAFELIEINPRFPAWVDFPAQIGCNLPAALLDRLFAVPAAGPLARCPAGRLFIRHALDVVGDLGDLATLGRTGTLRRAWPILA